MSLSVRALLWFLLFAVLGAPAARAVLPIETPPPAEVVPQAEVLQKELDDLVQEFDRLQQKKTDIASLLQQAPELVLQMRREIGRLEKQHAVRQVPGTPEAVEQAIALLDAQVRSVQISLNDVMDRIGEQQALPTQAREQVTSAQKRINQLQDRLREQGDPAAVNPAANLRGQVLRQQLLNVTLRRDNAQSQLEGYQRLLELYTANRDLLLLQLGVIKSSLDTLRAERDSRRQESAEQQQEEERQLQSALGHKHSLMLTELETNQRLSRTLYALTDELTKASDSLSAAKQELQDLRYRYEMAQQQLKLTQAHQQVDDYLVRQRQTLQARIKEQREAVDLSIPISHSRLDQFKYDDQLQQLRTQVARDQLIDQLLAKNVDQEVQRQTSLRADLQSILTTRAELLTKLVEVNANHVVALTNLELVKDEQLLESERFFEMLNQKLLWRRTSPPLQWSWLPQLPASALWFVSHGGWLEVLQTWYNSFVRPVYPVPVIGLVLGLLLWQRKRALHRLGVLRSHIGNVMKDQFRYTLEALLITVLLALPLPVLLLILASPLLAHPDASVFANSVGRALMSVSYWLFVLEFVRCLCLPDGLAAAHFSWRPEVMPVVRRWLPLLYGQIPLAVVYITVWAEGDEHQVGLIGRAAYLAMATLFLLFTWHVMGYRTGVLQQGEGGARYWYQRWGRSLFWLAVLVPTALLGLAFEGFNFSAMMLHQLLHQTIVLTLGIFVLDQVFTRWFAVQERKLALERALKRRGAMKKAKGSGDAAKDGGKPLAELELPRMDVATISEQNRSLLKVLFYGAFLAVAWWVWRDTFLAANFFDEVVLWHYGGGDDPAQQNAVTLGTVVFTLAAILLTYASVKNLPGLIEVVVLQRFGIDSDIRFAVTTTARYLVVLGGISLVTTMIGLDWSKLGWLVAALGVGLGFGLQEIFANFVSGLIILYERPIRIGDTVTINDLSGTVTRIHMRATTILDWDQKEIIIPNKTFVTSQFINWTLSNELTRLVVKVGVLFGSDTELVTRTLLEIARENPKVLRDPEPAALLLSFGPSDLQFELRVFLDQFSVRMQTMHELNMEINKRFAALGIRLAFPQLDLHVKQVPGGSLPGAAHQTSSSGQTSLSGQSGASRPAGSTSPE